MVFESIVNPHPTGGHVIHIRDKELAIVEAARAGKVGRALATEYNVSASTISNILRKHGVKPPIGRRPSCGLDHAAFDNITPESAYWMGMLCADGCVVDYQNGAPQIILDLAEKDRAHVEAFRAFLKSTHAISTLNRKKTIIQNREVCERKSISFRVRSTPVAEALARHGIAGKSPLRVPSKDLAASPDFWRGCVDGDGTVRIHVDERGHGYRYPHIMLCGHRPLIECFQTFLKHEGVEANITDTSSGIYQIRLMSGPALKVVKLLYSKATISLERKWDDAKAILHEFV